MGIPTYGPERSAQVLLRVAPATREKLKRIAARSGLSMNSFIELLIKLVSEDDLVAFAEEMKLKATTQR